MADTKRLFISTSYVDLDEITKNPNIKQYDTFGSNESKIWPIDNADVKSATLFLISQDLSNPSALDSLQINKEGFEDYLLYHEDNTKNCIINKFKKSRTQPGHHAKYRTTNEIEYRAFAEALRVILDETDETIAINKKAEAIINIIWPGKSVLKKEVQKFLSSYKREAPASNAECPSVFSTTEMKTAFDELKLKGKSIDDRDSYTASLAKLNEAVNAYYYDAN